MTRIRSDLDGVGLFAACLLLATFCPAGVHAATSAPQEPPSAPEPAAPSQPPSASPRPAEIQPPELQAFHPADYPQEAQQQGLEADVLLELQIGADGVVTESRVLEPAGHGFDEAARAATLKFQFSPARRHRRPAAARIHYRYTFRLERPPSAEPRSAPAPTAAASGKKNRKRARIVGRTTTGPDGIGVAGARVVLETQDGSTRDLITDAEGRFSLDDAPAGRCRVEVTAAGYGPVRAEVSSKTGATVELPLVLEPLAEPGPDAVEISVHEDAPSKDTTRHTLSQRELTTMPGSMGDAVRSVQNLPGVAPTPIGSAQLIVRGTSPQDSLSYVEGLQVLNVYHLWGLSSVVPTEMLDRLDFYPGNYGVRYGRGLGGLIELGLRDPNPDGRYHGLAQIDLIDARAMLEGPVPGAKGWSFVSAARRSHLDAVAMPVLGWDISPAYYDYQFLLVHHPSARSRLRIGVIGSDDQVRFSGDDDLRRTELNIASGFVYFFSDYRAQVSRQVTWAHTVAVGHIYQRFGLTSLDQSYSVNAPIYPVAVRTELGWRVLRGLALNVGTDIHYAPFRVRLRVPEANESGPQRSDQTAYDPLAQVDSRELYFRPAAYAEAIATPSDRLRIAAGLRADYARDIDRVDLSPRVSARYHLLRDPLRTTVKGGAGIFYQPPLSEQTLTGYGSPGLRSSRAMQTSLGFEQELGSDVEASLEGFYYHLEDLVQRHVAGTGELEFVNSGSGHTMGLETLLRIKPTNRIYGWLAYTLARSMRRTASDQPLSLYSQDATHVLTALASYRLGRGWEVGGKFQYISGKPYTPIVGALYSSTSDSYVPISGSAQSSRLPAYHELDLRVQKRWQVGQSGAITSYLDLINVYDKDRYLGVACSPDYTRCTYEKHPMPIIPSVGVRGEF